MNRDLHNYRDSYEKGELLLETTASDPIVQFSNWFKEVEEEGSTKEANAVTLTTLGADGFPKGRIVLLKAFSKEGFIFYTNYNSEKGKSLAGHPKAGLSFFWPALERQVILKGTVTKIDADASDAYFASRPKDSQVGALVSNQSSETTREELEKRKKLLLEEYRDKEIKRPSHWGGYVLKPESIEFWQGRPSRLHDRIVYKIDGEGWIKNRLAP